MLLAPIVESLEEDLKRAAAVGGDETRRVADVLVEAMGASVRLRLLDALQQAADELTASFPGTSVEMRLQGNDPFLSLSTAALAEPFPRAEAVERSDDEPARVTLRLPEALKTKVEQAAAREGISVNSWLVDAATRALQLPFASRRGPRRMTGFVRG
jgi:HicB family